VLGQDYPNLEYIVIDGGSSDGSQEIIRQYEDRLAFWCSEPDGGHYEGVNKGFARSSGEIMAWLNADDMYCPWALRTAAAVMTALPDVEWITTLNPLTWTCGGFCRSLNRIPGYSKASFLDGCYIPNGGVHLGWIQQESTFWRRSLWQRSGGMVRTDYRLAGDFDLWARFYDFAELHGINCPLGGFRSQPKQRSRNLGEYLREAELSLEQARHRNGWKPAGLGFRAARKVPVLRRWALRRPLNVCRTVMPVDEYAIECGWRIEDVEFR